MGTWGVGVFQNDLASDVRAGFRELIGAGRSAEEATAQLIQARGPWADDTADDRVAWLALALVQWQTGRLMDTVRDRAIEAIDARADLDLWEPELVKKRAVVLSRARATLLSPQRSPTRIRRAAVPQSPFSPGDIVRYRGHSGREIALWAMANSSHTTLTTISVNTEFHLLGIGDPDLIPIEDLIAGDRLILTSENGWRHAHQFDLWLPQQATAPAWSVVAQVPFPVEWRSLGLTQVLVRSGRGAQRAGVDDVIEKWWQSSRRHDPEAEAVQALLDAAPTVRGLRRGWDGYPLDVATEVAIEVVKALAGAPEPAALHWDVFTMAERLASGDDGSRRVVAAFLGALGNVVSHPEVPVSRYELERSLGPKCARSQEEMNQRWQTSESGPDQPAELRRHDEWVWTARARWRRLDDGRYARRATRRGTGLANVRRRRPGWAPG